MKKMLQNLRNVQNEKGSIEAQLGQKSAELNTQVKLITVIYKMTSRFFTDLFLF